MSQSPQKSRGPSLGQLMLVLLVLVAILAPLGAVLAYPHGKTVYTSTGIVHILAVKPRVIYATGLSEIPRFDEFMLAESQAVVSPRVIHHAMEDARWKAWRPTFPGLFADTLADETNCSPNGQLLNLSMTDADPKVAQLGVQTITQAYVDFFTDGASQTERMIDGKLDNLAEELQSDVANDQAALNALAEMNPYQTLDLTAVYDGVLKQVQLLSDEIQRARAAPGTADAHMPSTNPMSDMDLLQSQFGARKQELAEIGKARIVIAEQKEKLSQDQIKLKEVQDRRQQLNVERPMADRIDVWSDGTLPDRPSSDTHIEMAEIGGGSGAGLGFLIFCTIGLNQRFRGASSAASEQMRNRKGDLI